jgi:DNA-binding MarR family transcriptional regulator
MTTRADDRAPRAPRSATVGRRAHAKLAGEGAAKRDAKLGAHADENVGSLLFRARRVLWTAVSRRLDAAGESPHAFALLNQLAVRGPLNQRELAERVGQHPAGVSRLLDELDALGFVARHRDASDRRCVVVDLTAAGRRRREAAWPVVVEAMDDTLAPLSSDERRQLRELLAKLAPVDCGDPSRA